MKLSIYLFLIIHIISLFLPIIHLVEISHAEKHEIHKNIIKDNSSQTPECNEYTFSVDLEKSVSFLNQVYQSIDIPKNIFFQEKIKFENIYSLLLSRGQDPPLKNTFTSLVGIVKIQIFSVI